MLSLFLTSRTFSLLETRIQHYNQVLQLRGKLELLTMHAMDRPGDTVLDTENKLSWKMLLMSFLQLVVIQLMTGRKMRKMEGE
jgi:hypothetical protein